MDLSQFGLNTRTQHVVQYLQVFLSAGLMWAAFPDLDLWFLAVPSLALLVAATDRVRMGRAAWYSSIWAMAFFLPHISWMNIATGNTYLAWILLAAAQAFFISLWGWFFGASRAWKWCRTWVGEASVAAVLWVGIEQLRSRVPYGGFPWAKIAYVQVDSPLAVFAPFGGEVLVSALAMFLAVCLRFALAAPSVKAVIRSRSVWSVERITVGKRVFLAVLFCGVFLAPSLVKLPTAQQNGSVQVAAIQGNVEIPMENTYSIEGKVTGNHLQQTLELTKSGAEFDLLIWGEDSIDFDPNVSKVTSAQVAQALELAQVPLLAGYQEYANGVRYNWMAVWYPESGQGPQKYGKQHPVPWGEYVPFRELSEGLATAAAQVAVDMVPVDNKGYLDVTLNDGRTIPIAVGICFEAADEPILAEGVRAGGQLVFIPTNNSHFQYSAESTQQLQMLRFRSIEFSRAGLQVSTNGVSAVVGPDGGIRAITAKQESAYIVADIPLRTTVTPAAFLGETPALVAMVVTVFFGVVSTIGVIRIRRRKNGS